jgi:hypothetical protein
MNTLITNPRTDKAESGYLEKYERHLHALQDQKIKLLELGIREGGSLLMWEKYFPNGTICGIDSDSLPADIISDRVVMRKGDQANCTFLSSVADEVAPEGFDIIIDDASHLGALSKASFDHLFNKHLKPGGLYVVEDWGTGYWNSFSDGRAYREPTMFSLRNLVTRKRRFKNHDYGMVGFVKQIVDLVAWDDITKPRLGITGAAPAAVESMEICSGIVFIRKKAL